MSDVVGTVVGVIKHLAGKHDQQSHAGGDMRSLGGADFHKLAKHILGSGSNVKRNGPGEYKWSKRGGYAEGKIRDITNKIEEAGFDYVPIESRDVSSQADGGSIARGSVWRHPSGYEVEFNTFYGATKGSNRFSVTLKRNTLSDMDEAYTAGESSEYGSLFMEEDDAGDILKPGNVATLQSKHGDTVKVHTLQRQNWMSVGLLPSEGTLIKGVALSISAPTWSKSYHGAVLQTDKGIKYRDDVQTSWSTLEDMISSYADREKWWRERGLKSSAGASVAEVIKQARR